MSAIVVLFSMANEPCISLDSLAICAAISSFAMLLNCVYWLRLLDQTSFYILLLGETILDISPFMAIFVLSLMMFGIPLLLLNNNGEMDDEVVATPLNFWPSNLLINQYRLILGDFS